MKKKEAGKTISAVIWIFLLALAAYIVIKGLSLDKGTLETIMLNIQQQAIETYFPGLTRSDREEISPSSWLLEKTRQQIPGMDILDNKEQAEEDEKTSEKIVEENQEFLEARLIEENQEAGPDSSGLEITGGAEGRAGENETQSASAAPARVPVTDISLEQFQDFDFVIRNFYTVDSTTSITSEQLNAPALVQMDLRMKTGNDQPQILIYHTHSQEEFIDSVSGDASTTIVGVGSYLAQILKEDYGYNVIHVTDTFDIVDGKLDRNQAYSYAQERISQVLEENPSIEVIIDLHRDGVADDQRLVTDLNGKQTAKVMFFNGLSRTRQNGEISYLPNPYIQDNLAFSLQMMLACEKYYPDFARTIYLRGYRYNLHLRPKTLLVECGAQTNTVEEEMNAMEPLADVLNKVLTGT
ncbi:MAG TPA: stage II sporulation protein P [Candidatus Blautia stercoripullorum]|uniref:Stage II sporulation protein P n=1 Tax=Candidatus Blautia stercoripullorum TaxID=2838502 RepID=A0A9D2R992_9FIRM|nr:stage II sporulation protein P [Candidatus Blautia stercoripullorum]